MVVVLFGLQNRADTKIDVSLRLTKQHSVRGDQDITIS